MIVDAVNKTARKVPAWPLYLIGVIPPVWLFYEGVTGGLGVDPVKKMEHQLGLWGLQLLIVTLLITPLRKFAGVNLLKFRRALGLLAFFYVVLHLLVWLVLDMQFLWEQMGRDILKRPYITIGMVGFAVMIPLAITSNNWSIRKLGGMKWRKLHRLTYLAAIAGAAHYMMLVKAWPLEPILYCAVVAGLLLLRVDTSRLRAGKRIGKRSPSA